MNSQGEGSAILTLHEHRAVKTAAAAIGLAGILYLLWKTISLHGQDLSFRYLWFAGSLWLDGINPYGPQYQEIAHELFSSFNGQPFYYPPNWWPFSAFMGSFEYQTAMEIWRSFNTLAVITSTLLLNCALKRLNVNISPAYLIFYTGIVSFMQATVISLSTGQTSILMYFSTCLIIYASLAGRNIILAFGFALILLKPQIGVPLMIAFLPFRKYHLSIFYASALTFLCTLPALITVGPIITITSFLNGLSQYSAFVSNAGSNSTGLKNIFITFIGFDISSNVATLASIVAAAATGYYFSQREKTTSEQLVTTNQSLFFMTAIAVVCFFSPLHEYDLVLLAPILLLATTETLRFQYFVYAAYLLNIRPGNIAELFGPHNVDDGRYYTAVVVTLALLSILGLLLTKIRRAAA